MDEIKAYAVARIAIGASALVATGPALRRWLGRAADRPETRLVARSAGIRDVAIGVGTLLAVKHDAPVRGWLEAAVLSDAGDLVASLLGLGSLPRVPVLGTAGASLGGMLYGRRLIARVTQAQPTS